MWNLKSVNKDTYNCFQYLVATISKFYDCDYRLMMLELWGFKYDANIDGSIGDKLGLCWNFEVDIRNELLKYHGLSLDIEENINLDTIKTIIRYSETTPVAVSLDSFFCNWLPFYGKQHRPHTIFILDAEENEFRFIDQYSDDFFGNKIDFAFINEQCKHIIKFTKIDVSESKNINQYISESIRRFDEKEIAKQYELFIGDMKTKLNIPTEIIDDPVASKLIMYLKNIAEDRLNFVEAICLFEENYSIDLSVAKDSLVDISERYEKLKAYIIKCAFSHRSQKTEIIANELDRIYSSELQIYDVMKVLEQKKGGSDHD